MVFEKLIVDKRFKQYFYFYGTQIFIVAPQESAPGVYSKWVESNLNLTRSFSKVRFNIISSTHKRYKLSLLFVCSD
jgi:hypothetical protein